MLIDHDPEDLVKGVMRFGPDILENCTSDIKQLQCYINRIAQEHLDYPVPLQQVDPSHWFIPERYKIMANLPVNQTIVACGMMYHWYRL